MDGTLEEARQIEAVLEEYLARATDLRANRPSNAGTEALKAAFTSLKNDLKTDGQHGTLDGRRRERTALEDRYFYPPVWRSVSALSIVPTSTKPKSSKWNSGVEEIETLFQEYLRRLRMEFPKDEP